MCWPVSMAVELATARTMASWLGALYGRRLSDMDVFRNVVGSLNFIRFPGIEREKR
jgi:hypothetical protein